MNDQKKLGFSTEQGSFEYEGGQSGPGEVTCLGKTFPSDDARREHFLEKLWEKLKDPEFRKTPGFPKGTDEDILRLSDPPYYTACPNPFLEDYVREHGQPFDSSDAYHREPFAVDVSVGKTDALYRAHSYHTKVPHLAIVPSILHYTKPGDLVLDGFCGSGLIGVAVQFCGTAPREYRKQVVMEWKKEGREAPKWGSRRAILGDLGPAATFIAANYNQPFELSVFSREAKRILKKIRDELGWMYETLHNDGKTKGRINYTLWSEVFGCPHCTGDIVFAEQALDPKTKRVRESFSCPGCRSTLKKSELEQRLVAYPDSVLGSPSKKALFRAVIINYSTNDGVFEKQPDDFDLETLERIERLPLPAAVPALEFPFDDMWEAPRMRSRGISHTHHLYHRRAAIALGTLWTSAIECPNDRIRHMLLFLFEQGVRGMALLNRYKPIQYGRPGGSQVGLDLPGSYYIASLTTEVSPDYQFGGKLARLSKAFSPSRVCLGQAAITTGDCASLPVPDDCIDYVFTDPPFGDNYPYAELNLLCESWHRVVSQPDPEAIVDRGKKNRAVQRGISDYQRLMQGCFAEYYRVLKPGRWMTVVFSNSKNAVWRAIQEAIGNAGFVVADVRSLDKKQGSFKQVTSLAVKQDLVISAYKPTTTLENKAQIETVSDESAWSFVREHLGNLPVFVSRSGEAEVIAERTPQVLLDRMIAFHVQRGLAVPISSTEFFAGLDHRFPERDRMYFLPDQVAQYDRKRISITKLQQLSLFPTDEASAIVWLRQQLHLKPQTYQDLAPVFMKEIHAWAKHEQTVELRQILEQNFLCYDGTGPVPSQIHSYLSTTFKDLRNLDKEDSALVAKAEDRWYVPDTSKQGDLEKTREKQLLREFEEYRTTTKRKLKLFRTEAVRVGFKAAYDRQEYRTIIDVAHKLPDTVLQEDEKLLMYYDVALTRLGED